jgi:hypothetical protein
MFSLALSGLTPLDSEVIRLVFRNKVGPSRMELRLGPKTMRQGSRQFKRIASSRAESAMQAAA